LNQKVGIFSTISSTSDTGFLDRTITYMKHFAFGIAMMNIRKRSRRPVSFVVALLLFSAFAGASAFLYAHSQATSAAQSATVQTSVQSVSLSDYNAPAIQGTTQSNGTALYIPARTEGNLGFQLVMSQQMASANPQIIAYVNGQALPGCGGIMSLREVSSAAVENMGCTAPVTPINSANNVTILVYSPFAGASGVYRYQSTIVTVQAS
jgi:hypothetical protein